MAAHAITWNQDEIEDRLLRDLEEAQAAYQAATLICRDLVKRADEVQELSTVAADSPDTTRFSANGKIYSPIAVVELSVSQAVIAQYESFQRLQRALRTLSSFILNGELPPS